jgi:hypothetical protein
VNPAWYLGGMSRPTPAAYKTRNWPAYNEALKRRGSLTIWFDPAMTWEAAPTGKRGRQPDYSGEAKGGGMPANMAARNGASGARSTSVARQWFACKPREGPPAVQPQSSRPARTPSPGSPTQRGQSPATKLCAHQKASVEPSGDPSRQHPADAPAGQWIARVSAPKPRRDQPSHGLQANHCRATDALCETAGTTPHGAGLRPSGGRVPGPCHRTKRLHGARHTSH